ncbi:hypothetical protein HII31_01929 [Pseudocercospora fuligena]|uniref:F-box domain-containing protein n=1 Tax=Pseudocercospora fuligena TaxID=685502 RepID=A0A8H6VQ98_9PEZI|nr:hypothetical protein HII31_01929 [Pseudocercospora fuligena]
MSNHALDQKSPPKPNRNSSMMPSLSISFGAVQNLTETARAEGWRALKTPLPMRLHTMDQQDIQQLKEDQEAIKNSLSEAMRHIDMSTDSGQQLQRNVKDIEARSMRTAQHARHLFEMIPISARAPTDKSVAKAQEVFATPELLEEILRFATPPDMLSAMQVQRCWYDTVLGSIMIKRLLGLEPFEKGLFYSPFSKRFHDLIPDSKSDYQPMPAANYGDWVHADRRVRICITITNMDKLTLGSRIRKMIICSIPFTKASVSMRCTSGRCLDTDLPPGRTYTLGELADLIRGKRANRCEHHDCQIRKMCFDAEVKLGEQEDLGTL